MFLPILYLSANCYKKVKDETTEFQEEIEKVLGLDPIEKEVIVLYKGEKSKQPEEFWEVRHWKLILLQAHCKKSLKICNIFYYRVKG